MVFLHVWLHAVEGTGCSFKGGRNCFRTAFFGWSRVEIFVESLSLPFACPSVPGVDISIPTSSLVLILSFPRSIITQTARLRSLLTGLKRRGSLPGRTALCMSFKSLAPHRRGTTSAEDEVKNPVEMPSATAESGLSAYMRRADWVEKEISMDGCCSSTVCVMAESTHSSTLLESYRPRRARLAETLVRKSVFFEKEATPAEVLARAGVYISNCVKNQ